MASIVADIAAFEVVKFYGGVLQPQAGALVEVNLLANKMTARKVLKIPRCPACSLLNTRPPITPKQNAFVLSEEIPP
jgi:hypothetical protein